MSFCFRLKNILFLLIVIIILAGQSAMSKSNPESVTPTSARSLKAIHNVEQQVKQSMALKGMKYGAPVFLRIFKQEKELEIWIEKDNKFQLFKTYPVCTYGAGDLGPKLREGDGQAPEGFYFVKPNQLNPYSSYHLSFNLGYPNAYDRYHKRTGSLLMVHGDCVSIGCFAMTDNKIEEIYAVVDAALNNGQSIFRVHAFPFRMTEENLSKHKSSKWYDFWKNLKEGYDWFEKNNFQPPNVKVKNGRYIFEPLINQ